MDEPDGRSHSFIVKVWLEKTVEEDGEVLWRGHITHVQSRERRYFKELSEISDFIVPYLERWGAKSSWAGRVRGWLPRRRG